MCLFLVNSEGKNWAQSRCPLKGGKKINLFLVKKIAKMYLSNWGMEWQRETILQPLVHFPDGTIQVSLDAEPPFPQALRSSAAALPGALGGSWVRGGAAETWTGAWMGCWCCHATALALPLMSVSMSQLLVLLSHRLISYCPIYYNSGFYLQ